MWESIIYLLIGKNEKTNTQLKETSSFNEKDMVDQ